MANDLEKTNKIYLPADKPEDWKPLLADPVKHWRSGYSAKTLAYCWQTSNGFPESVKKVFSNARLPVLDKIELILAIPEYKVRLDGGLRDSQNDIFILAKSNDALMTITVEGKVDEDFGPLVRDWLNTEDERTKKPGRLGFLVKKLNIENKDINDIRYQLLHRTASALIEAERFNTKNAMMLVHSFSQTYNHFDDYAKFLSLYDINAEKDSVQGPCSINGVALYFSWVKGEKKFLSC